MQTIVQQLHFRYQLGFRPSQIDGKRHELRVELIGDVKKEYKSVQLRFRPEYQPALIIAGTKSGK